MNYYKVDIMKAHNSSRYGTATLTFAIEAPNAMVAIDYARAMPGVKHHRIDAIKGVRQITHEEYIEARKRSAYHP